MVCYARAISLMWMILRNSRRRDAESLYDRAHSGSSALVAALDCFVLACARGSVARGYSGGRGGLHAASLARTAARVSCYAPYGRLHTLALPPWLATQFVECSRHSRAWPLHAHDRTRSRIIRDAVGPCPPHARRAAHHV